ncbi:MAG: competence protein CoiA [Colwellia sp.]|nr:competence protein CoiA [Colwellia sp.]MCW9082249.1 competence protein CoiA [Colwellia sp.]
MKIPLGVDKATSKLVLINDLTEEQRGLKSNCICPECKSDLVAKMGDKTIWHFAHYKGTESRNCQETALHLLGKYVLSKLDSIKLPPYKIGCRNQKDILKRSYSMDDISIFGEENLLIISSEQEKTIGDIKGDVFSKVQYTNNNFFINFEINVWHKVDEVKLEKIRKLNISTVEIDLAHLLNENQVDFDIVKAEINKAINQRIIFLANDITEPFRTELKEKLDKKVKAKNNQISRWAKEIEENLTSNGVTLPTYTFSLEYFANDEIQKVIDSKLGAEPKIEKKVQVIKFKHVHDNQFEMLCSLGNKTKELVVLADINELPTSNRYKNAAPSYLIFNEIFLDSSNKNILFEWGENEVALNYQKKYNSIVKSELKKIKAKKLEKINKYLEQVDQIFESDVMPISPNLLQIKKQANCYYKELIQKGYSEERLKSVVDEYIDYQHIYGCEPKYWQLIAFRDIHWVDNDTIDIEFLSKRLTSLGVTLVDPYKQLLFNSKLMKANNVDLPFTTPFSMLKMYLNHLMGLGLLKKGRGARYQKQFRYGKSYKSLKLNDKENYLKVENQLIDIKF